MRKQAGRLFLVGVWLGTTVFGGINVAYPAIRAKAEANDWLSGEEVDGLYAVSVLLPGPSFMNLWGAVSGRVAGVAGTLAGLAGLLLPSASIVLTLMLLVRLPAVMAHSAGLMRGAGWATAGLLALAGLEGFGRLRTRWQRWLMAGVFGLLLLGIHPLVLLGLAVLLGATVSPWLGRKERA